MRYLLDGCSVVGNWKVEFTSPGIAVDNAGSNVAYFNVDYDNSEKDCECRYGYGNWNISFPSYVTEQDKLDYLHYNGDCCEKDKGEGNMYFKCGHRVLVENTGNYGYNFADYDVCTDNPNVKACCGNPTDCVTPDGKCVVENSTYNVNPNIGSTIDGPNEVCSQGHWCPANFQYIKDEIDPFTKEITKQGYCQYIPRNCYFNPERDQTGEKCGITPPPSKLDKIYELTKEWYTDLININDPSRKSCVQIEGTNDACCLDVQLSSTNRDLDYYKARPIRIY